MCDTILMKEINRTYLCRYLQYVGAFLIFSGFVDIHSHVGWACRRVKPKGSDMMYMTQQRCAFRPPTLMCFALCCSVDCTVLFSSKADEVDVDGRIDRCFARHLRRKPSREVRGRCTPAFVVISRYRSALANEHRRCKVLLVTYFPCTGNWRQDPR